MILTLQFTLKSDATFGSGGGVAGYVDSEIEYDAETGLPFVRGRTLRGMLVEECANLLYAIGKNERLEKSADYLFGNPGSTLANDGHLRIGPAQLPDPLRKAIELDVKAKHLYPIDVLESFTAVPGQTSVSADGTPEEKSLRSMRVLLRELRFSAELTLEEPEDADFRKDVLSLLTVCVKAWRRGGTARNRGRGRVDATLGTENETKARLTDFQTLLEGVHV